MRKFLFILLFVLSSWLVTAQTAQRTFENGTRAASEGNYREALAQYQKLLAQNESANLRAKIHYNLGVCYYHLNEYPAAIAEYEKAVKLRPDYQKAFRALAMAHIALKNWRAAETHFGEALLLDNADGESWFDLAMVLLELKNYDSAAAAFRRAIKNKTIALAASHNNLGVILALNDDLPAAEKEFKTALRESSGAFAEARANLEFCRRRRGNSNKELRAKLQFIAER